MPIPSTIIAAILLLILMYFKYIKLEHIEECSNFLMNNVTLFITPLVIGIMDKLHYFNLEFLKLILILIAVVIISILATAKFTEFIINIFSEKREGIENVK